MRLFTSGLLTACLYVIDSTRVSLFSKIASGIYPSCSDATVCLHNSRVSVFVIKLRSLNVDVYVSIRVCVTKCLCSPRFIGRLFMPPIATGCLLLDLTVHRTSMEPIHVTLPALLRSTAQSKPFIESELKMNTIA